MFKVPEHKRLATGGYKGPQGTGRDIKGDSWKDSKKKSKKRKKSKVVDVDDVQKVKKSKRRKGGKLTHIAGAIGKGSAKKGKRACK